jgi:putative ABC transport system permease protein
MNFPVKIRAASAQMALDQAVEDLDDMLDYAKYVIIFMSVIMFLCVGNTISMSTSDRMREFGTLRSLGFEKKQIFHLILSESVLLSLLGGAAGCIATFLLMRFTNQQVAVRGVTILITTRTELAAAGIGISVLIGIISGLIPALRVSRLNITAALHSNYT